MAEIDTVYFMHIKHRGNSTVSSSHRKNRRRGIGKPKLATATQLGRRIFELLLIPIVAPMLICPKLYRIGSRGNVKGEERKYII